MPSAPTRRHRRLPASVRQHMHIGAKAKVIGFLEKAYTRSDAATTWRVNHERRPCARQARNGEPVGAPARADLPNGLGVRAGSVRQEGRLEGVRTWCA